MVVNDVGRIFEECGKSFCCASNLAQHGRVHTGGNPVYVRNVVRLLVMLELRLHHRICSGAKPFECVKCGNSYVHFKL